MSTITALHIVVLLFMFCRNLVQQLNVLRKGGNTDAILIIAAPGHS